ncbi:MAG: sulfur carrier protein ThiS [Wenzhouxiangellaceae bacterium]
MIEIQLNGQAHSLDRPLTLSALLTQLGLLQRPVAVERNGEIVPRSRLDQERVEAGDRIEIVQAIGGG